MTFHGFDQWSGQHSANLLIQYTLSSTLLSVKLRTLLLSFTLSSIRKPEDKATVGWKAFSQEDARSRLCRTFVRVTGVGDAFDAERMASFQLGGSSIDSRSAVCKPFHA
jgi:hypothetical protein